MHVSLGDSPFAHLDGEGRYSKNNQSRPARPGTAEMRWGRFSLTPGQMKINCEIWLQTSKKGNPVVVMTITPEDGKSKSFYWEAVVRQTIKHHCFFSNETRAYVQWLYQFTTKAYEAKTR